MLICFHLERVGTSLFRGAVSTTPPRSAATNKRRKSPFLVARKRLDHEGAKTTPPSQAGGWQLTAFLCLSLSVGSANWGLLTLLNPFCWDWGWRCLDAMQAMIDLNQYRDESSVTVTVSELIMHRVTRWYTMEDLARVGEHWSSLLRYNDDSASTQLRCRATCPRGCLFKCACHNRLSQRCARFHNWLMFERGRTSRNNQFHTRVAYRTKYIWFQRRRQQSISIHSNRRSLAYSLLPARSPVDVPLLCVWLTSRYYTATRQMVMKNVRPKRDFVIERPLPLRGERYIDHLEIRCPPPRVGALRARQTEATF